MNRIRACRGSLWLLLAAALLMRALIPTGFMPLKAENGTITVTLCQSSGVLHIPLSTNEDDRPEQSRDLPACAFSVFLGGWAPPPAMAALPGVLDSDGAFAMHAQSLALTAASRLTPPATGPPLPA